MQIRNLDKTLASAMLPQDLYNHVLQIAGECDEAKLAELVQQGICLGVQWCSATPIQTLAKRGNHKAVELLIDRFAGNIAQVVMGYAQGGYIDQVNALLEPGGIIAGAIIGYAQVGNVTQVNALFQTRISKDPYMDLPDQIMASTYLNAGVSGYAAGGQVEELVNFLLAGGANINIAIAGYAAGGHVRQVNALLERGADINLAIAGYAQNGHIEQVNALLERGADINHAIAGYATGGHVDQVNVLLKRGADINPAIVGYATGGHVRQVNALLERGADINLAIGGYAVGEHVSQISALLERGADINVLVYLFNPSPKHLLRLLSFNGSEELRKQILDNASQFTGIIDNPASFLETAAKLNHKMKVANIGFTAASVSHKLASLISDKSTFFKKTPVESRKMPSDPTLESGIKLRKQ